MALKALSADERNSAAHNRTSLVIFGPYGVGKTSLLHTLPAEHTTCIDIEAGMKSVASWRGSSIEIETFQDFQDLDALIGGPDPAVAPDKWYSVQHWEHVCKKYAGTAIEDYAHRPVIFVDSISKLTRLAMTYAQQQPEAFNRKGQADTRGAYGLLARVVINALDHLQHASGKTLIFVGLLEWIKDENGGGEWVPQLEGSKAGRELPGIVDQVISMQTFAKDEAGEWVLDPSSEDRMLLTKTVNPYGLPAKDRSGRLDLLEMPDLSALLTKINQR